MPRFDHRAPAADTRYDQLTPAPDDLFLVVTQKCGHPYLATVNVHE
jgi:hypothetical protein